MNKIKSDQTLQGYTKAELIDVIRALEHNWNVEKVSSERKTKIMQEFSEQSGEFLDFLVERVKQ